MKKNKTSLENSYTSMTKFIGYKPSDFRKLKQYRFLKFILVFILICCEWYKFLPQTMPGISNNFEDAKKTTIP